MVFDLMYIIRQAILGKLINTAPPAFRQLADSGFYMNDVYYILKLRFWQEGLGLGGFLRKKSGKIPLCSVLSWLYFVD